MQQIYRSVSAKEHTSQRPDESERREPAAKENRPNPTQQRKFSTDDRTHWSLNDPLRELEVLSASNRGRTVVCHNDRLKRRCVMRVSPYESKEAPSNLEEATASELAGLNQCAHRVLAFGKFVCKREKPIPGIIPFLAQPQVVSDSVVVEMYQEIRFGSLGRMDMMKYITEYSDDSLESTMRGLSYLYDVLVGMVELHRHGWAHCDISLENIVISMDRAYLIDFESVLPFNTENLFALRRRDFGVPVKIPFVPPEHIVSSADDLISIPSYDVWAFGVCLFAVLFREYLFAVYKQSSRMMICKKQLKYFLKYGFGKFMCRYHPEKFDRMTATERRGRFECQSSLYALGGDLLEKIFRRARCVPARETKGSDDPSPVYFDDRSRFGMQDVLDHPFWYMNGLIR